MKNHLIYPINLLLIFSLLMIIGFGTSYIRITKNYNQSATEVERSHRIMYLAEVVFSLLKDVETMQRGYIITANKTFIDHYKSALKKLKDQLLVLENESKKDSAAILIYNELLPVIDRRIYITEKAISLVRSGNQPEAVKMVNSGIGKRIMDSVRVEKERIQDYELSKVEILSKEKKSYANKRLTLGILAVAGYLFLIFFIYVAIVRGIKNKTMLESELQHKNDELKQANNQIVSVNDELKVSNHELNLTMEKLNSINQQLEKRVAERTKELFEANLQLQAKNKQILASDRKLKTSNDQLRHSVEELNNRNYELDQLVYKISHDLRAPLSSILGLIQLFKLETDAKAIENIMDMIKNRAYKLDHFIKSMLDFTRNNRTAIASELINFDQLIKGIIEELEYLKNFNRLKITINIDTQAPFMSDILRLRIIFNNILSNAYKYMDVNKSENFLDINIIQQTTEAEITFVDNGIGIKKEYMDKIFDMFFRASELSDGSGLGLYILKQAIDHLNGTVLFESKLGEGSTIRINIPNLVSQQSQNEIHS